MSVKGIKAGTKVVFKGYGEDVPEADRVFTEGETYEVVEVDADNDSVSVEIPNPNFNPKKKASTANPEMVLMDMFEEEFELATAKPAKAAAKPAAKAGRTVKAAEAEAEDETVDDDSEEAAPPASKARAGKAAAPAAKAKTKAAPPKAAAKTKAKVEDAEGEEEDDAIEELEQEDEEILKLVQDSEDLLELAQEMAEESAAQDYKLGGILYHIRLSKVYQSLNEEYAKKGGFGLYVKERLNVEYRKAMYLIDIYFKFNKYGIDAAKVAALGWTKASKIAAVMTDDNAEELVELAEETSVSDLSENIKANYKEVGATKGDKKKIITFKFRLFEDAAEAVRVAIESAKASLGFDSDNDAFEYIITEWATEHPMKAPATAPAGRRVNAPATKAAAAKGKAAVPAARSASRAPVRK